MLWPSRYNRYTVSGIKIGEHPVLQKFLGTFVNMGALYSNAPETF